MAAKGIVFSWNLFLKEFETTKLEAKSLDFLSPYNPEKDLYITTSITTREANKILDALNRMGLIEAEAPQEKKKFFIQKYKQAEGIL